MAPLLLMPAVSLSFVLPFFICRVRDRVLRGVWVSVSLTTVVIGFAVLIAVVDNKHLVGMFASVCVVAVVSTIIAVRIAERWDHLHLPKGTPFLRALHR